MKYNGCYYNINKGTIVKDRRIKTNLKGNAMEQWMERGKWKNGGMKEWIGLEESGGWKEWNGMEGKDREWKWNGNEWMEILNSISHKS